MGNYYDSGTESERHERAIAALIESTTVSPHDVRTMFARELARLESGARVKTHLQTLTVSNVRGMLRRASER
jgi:hypothetical protein